MTTRADDASRRRATLAAELVAEAPIDAGCAGGAGLSAPLRQIVAEACDLLLELTFPAHFGRPGFATEAAEDVARTVLDELADRLEPALCDGARLHAASGESAASSDAETPSAAGSIESSTNTRDWARKFVADFLDVIPRVRAMIALDTQATLHRDPAASSLAEVILAYPGVLAIAIQRYAHELYTRGAPLVPRVMTEHAHRLTGIDIHPGARIGPRFCIDHGQGVVIGETTEIGAGVTIYQGVTLGALSVPDAASARGVKRHPTVADNVIIYANATILGGDTHIGENAIIGGSVFVTQSVAAGMLVTTSSPELRVRTARR
ncbi:MAG: hypothetical protein KDA32_07050 [Phycisphaerales bacterium]|nr:hypothetical protein [Phycisphaerales bacterium]